MTAPGPTGMPAARNARAKPTTLSAIWPVGGLRWLMAIGLLFTSSFRGDAEASNPESHSIPGLAPTDAPRNDAE